ncbi:MAG: hypothetical protein HY581_12795 [Nitrospirae bacterium]|nr:hypothetical protein [Nitrospirota bacterium]
MNLTIAFHGETRFDVISERHTLVTDQPSEDGGSDAGMSPVELFVGSLASCVGYFVARYCFISLRCSRRLSGKRC